MATEGPGQFNRDPPYNAGMEPLFTLENGRHVPTIWSRGPWSPELLHGSPPALLLARALEEARDDPALLISRLTVDLMRPVRMVPLHTTVQRIREGRRIRLVDAYLHDGDTVVARATALMLKRNETAPFVPAPSLPARLGSWQGLPTRIPEKVGNMTEESDDRLFHRGVDMRIVPRIHPGQPFAAWLRVPYLLLPGQDLTPFERMVAAADYVSPIGSMANPPKRGFINADFTLNMSREPTGEWLCFESLGRPDHVGIATSVVNLYDERGLMGSVACSCLHGSAS